MQNNRTIRFTNSKSKDLLKVSRIIKDKYGELYTIFNINQFSKEHNLDAGNLCKLLNNKVKTCKGFTLIF